MSERSRKDNDPGGLRFTRQADVPTPSPDTNSADSQEADRGKRQQIIDFIWGQTAVDPADYLRSDQLTMIPRSYQLELAELAKLGNVLVCLDTGTGKTLISVLLLQHVHQQAVDRPLSSHQPRSSASRPDKVSFFLVNLVPLVHQQSSVIAGNSSLAVGKLYGELKDSVRGKNNRLIVDGWRAPQWSALLESHQVIVSTAQCFLDALIHGFIKMDNVNLLIFDEVHHALKNHPYARIMKYYRLTHVSQRPKIFGMTASPIFTSTGQFAEASRYLQVTMDATIHTVSGTALQEFRESEQKPEELVVEFDPYLTALDDESCGVPMSSISKEMIALFGKERSSIDDAVLGIETEHFENEVRPRLDYIMRQLGPLGCDLFWHSTLLEYRTRARNWAKIDPNKRALVNVSWIVDAAVPPAILTPPEDQDSLEEHGETRNGSHSRLDSGLALAQFSTNRELNQRILLHMRSQPALPELLALDANNASPKLLRLIELLKCFAPSATNFCAIIFVERRQIATLLVELIKRIADLDFIHPEYLLGHDNSTTTGGVAGMDWHDQVQVLNRFRRRQPTNLLVATSIAEEGLDIQAANLVIRFDLFNRHISFLQSRGRARSRESRFIMMAEAGNREHAQAIQSAFKTEASRHKWLEGIAHVKHDGEAWEEDWRLELRIEPDEPVESGLCMFEPSTGARLFPEDAANLVSHYAATLHSEYLKDAVLAYRIETVDAGIGCPKSYISSLQLPSTSAVRSVESDPCQTKKQAKRLAAFRACQELRAFGELDEWLMPKFVGMTAIASASAEAGTINPHHEPWRGSGTPIHVPVKNLDGWARFRCGDAAAQDKVGGDDFFYSTFLPLNAFDPDYQPLLLLTRGPLPQTQLLKLRHPLTGRMKTVHPLSLGPLPPLGEARLEAITQLTKFIYKLISRERESSAGTQSQKSQRARRFAGKPAVLIVPVRKAFGVAEVRSTADLEFDVPANLKFSDLKLEQQSAEQLRDRVLIRTPCHNTYSLYKFEAIRYDLSPNSPTVSPESGPNIVASTQTFLTKHLRTYGRPHATCQVTHNDTADDLDFELASSPMLAVTKLPKASNLLSASPSRLQRVPYTSPGARLIVPYFYKVHPLPAALVSSVLLLPSILTRYDQLLLAHACNTNLFGGELVTDLVLQALASTSANCGFDYERLEFLGDTFLKLVATCHTFTTQLQRTEAELHLANKAILTNTRLLKEAKHLRLEEYGLFASSNLNVKRFVAPSLDNVGGVLVRRDMNAAAADAFEDIANAALLDKEDREAFDTIREKILADIAEALIGAALLSSPSSTSTALLVCRTLRLIPLTIIHLSDFNALLSTLKQQSIADNWQARVSCTGLDHLEKLFAYKYRYPHLGLEAFTHPSLLASVLPSYQRLEFLGDAWLDFHFVQKIFEDHKELTPGELTALKSLLASNATLSALGVNLGLHKYIASNSAMLHNTVNKYAELLEALLRKQEGEGGEQYWTSLSSICTPPKSIADVVEASFASVVVDSGFDVSISRSLFNRVFVPFYDKHCRFDSLQLNDAKRLIKYIFATMRRRLHDEDDFVSVAMETNLGSAEQFQDAAMDEEGRWDEERLVEALLTLIWVDLKVGGEVVGRVEVLARTAIHLQKAVGIVKAINELKMRWSNLVHRDATDEDTSQKDDDDDDDEEEEGMEARALSVSTAEALQTLLDEHEYLILQLARTLGWKRAFQRLTTGQNDESGSRQEAFSLAQLQELIHRSPVKPQAGP